MGRTAMGFLLLTSKPSRRRREASRELAYEDCFDCCALSVGADIYRHWAERVSSFYPPAAPGESTDNPVPGCRQRLAFCRILLRGAGPWWAAAALRLFRATCADPTRGGALQPPRVPHNPRAEHRRSRNCGLRAVGPGVPSVPRKLQGDLQREACDAKPPLSGAEKDAHGVASKRSQI